MKYATRAWRTLASAAALATALSVAAPAAEGKIAFALDAAPEGRASRIYLANPDGSDLHPVTGASGREREPAFSPDGKSIAYQSSSDLGIDTLVIQPLD